jgi:periplasmic divalent cation tolerance protein
MEPKCYQVQALVDSEEQARNLLTIVTHERLTVSARMLGPITSVIWDETVQESADKWIIMAMATRGRVADLTRRMKELHPNDIAEIIAVPVTGGNSQYIDWLMARSW